MRFDRIAVRVSLVALIGGLGGCFHSNNMKMTPVTVPHDPMPTTTKAQDSENAASIHTQLAQHYMELGDLEDALEKLKLAVKDDPNYVPAQTVIAVVYERINDMPNAEIHYRKAVQLAPTKGDPNNNLGAFLCRTGKMQEALPYFAKAEIDPFYGTPDVAWTNQGVCQLGLNDRPGADASFRKAIQINPNNANAMLQLANVLYLENDAFRASAFLQRYETLGQSSPDALKLGYEIESRLGNTDAALGYNKRLQSQFPDTEQAHALNSNARP
jgi:type IV pilus assembly protein PilF